jgi:hypothetical protein
MTGQTFSANRILVMLWTVGQERDAAGGQEAVIGSPPRQTRSGWRS